MATAGRRRRARLPRGSIAVLKVEVLAALVGQPSSGKTPALRPVIDAAKALERETDPHWRDDLARYERDTEVAKVATEKWQKEIKDAVANHKAAPDRPKQAAPREPPRRPRMVANDTTAEELMAMLAGNPRGLLLVRDELAGWLGSFGRYNNGGGADRGFYLETWNGGSFTTDRVKFSGKPIDIKYASLAIAGGIVPDRLREVLAGADDGLAARFIWIWPDAVRYRELRVAADDGEATRREMLAQAVRRLSALTFDLDGELGAVPRMMPLADDARAIFEEIRRDIAADVESTGLLAHWHGKTPARALRVALVIECLAWATERGGAQPKEVTAESMCCAQAYLDYARKMLRRVVIGLPIGQDLRDAARIARFVLEQRAKAINERDLYQKAGFHELRDPARRKTAFRELKQAGWLKQVVVPPANGRPRVDYLVNPKFVR
jgi:uncharacterized protein DUF3987